MFGKLRRALAEACIQLLTPDLIILDEFQRFTEIHAWSTARMPSWPRMLFEQPTTKVLLLSATPYKMLALDANDEESHFEGFEQPGPLPARSRQEHHVDGLRVALGEMRQGILGHRDPKRLTQAKNEAESLLRSVMVRTERLAVDREHDGMLDTQH